MSIESDKEKRWTRSKGDSDAGEDDSGACHVLNISRSHAGLA